MSSYSKSSAKLLNYLKIIYFPHFLFFFVTFCLTYKSNLMVEKESIHWVFVIDRFYYMYRRLNRIKNPWPFPCLGKETIQQCNSFRTKLWIFFSFVLLAWCIFSFCLKVYIIKKNSCGWINNIKLKWILHCGSYWVKIYRWQEEGFCCRDACRAVSEVSNTAPRTYTATSPRQWLSCALASSYCLLHFLHAYKQHLWLTSPGFSFWLYHLISLPIFFQVHFFFFSF